MTSSELKLNEICYQKDSRWENWQKSLRNRATDQRSKSGKQWEEYTRNCYNVILSLICLDEEEVDRQ